MRGGPLSGPVLPVWLAFRPIILAFSYSKTRTRIHAHIWISMPLPAYSIYPSVLSLSRCEHVRISMSKIAILFIVCKRYDDAAAALRHLGSHS